MKYVVFGYLDVRQTRADTLVEPLSEYYDRRHPRRSGPNARSPGTIPDLALQLLFDLGSDSMGHHDSEDHGWLVHRSRRRWNCGQHRCGM